MKRLAQITVELTDARIRTAVLGPVHTEFVSAFATASGRLGRRIVGLGVGAGGHVVLLAIFFDGRRSIGWGMGRWYSDLCTKICGECATQVTVK